jgi:hypothetical protein
MAYVVALIAASLLCLRRWAMFRTALTILLNALACAWAAQFSSTPWIWFAIFNASACVIATVKPAGRIQAVVGAIYVAELIVDLCYGVSLMQGKAPSIVIFHSVLDRLAIIQLGLYLCWIGGAGVRFIFDRWLIDHPIPVKAYLSRLDR